MNINLSPAFRSGSKILLTDFIFGKAKGSPPYLVSSGMFSLVPEGTLRKWP